MLVGKNNNLSLRWELNFIIMQILRKEIVLCYQPTWPLCHVGANQELYYMAVIIIDFIYTRSSFIALWRNVLK